MEAAECVYHGDSHSFAVLVGELRQAGVVRRQHAKLVAMTVCTCRRKVSYRQPISEQQAREAADHLLTPSLPLLDKLSPLARDLVTSSAQMAQRLPPVTSQTRLAVLVHQSLQEDFQLLGEEAAQVLKSRGRDSVTPKPKAKKKLSQDIVNRIIQKKKRRYAEQATFVLPVFGGSTHQLFRNPEVGNNFATIGRKHGCVLEIDREATAAKMAANVAETVVKVWCSSLEAGRDAEKALAAMAKEIQDQNSEQWRQAQERRKARKVACSWRLINDDHNQTADVKPQDYKVFLTRDFERKLHKKHRNEDKATNSTKRPAQRDDGSSIAQGHCLHCLLPFTRYRTDGNNGDVKTCRHHPGYVTEGKWTCCLKESDSQHPTHKEHAQSGCVVSRHSFRPHKRAARDVGAKAYRYERCFRQRRAPLAPHTLIPLIY